MSKFATKLLRFKRYRSSTETQIYYINQDNFIHRDDGPAIVSIRNEKKSEKYSTRQWQAEWLKNGQVHNADGPALILSSGTKEWFLNGKHHRTSGPAVVSYTGTQDWYFEGTLSEHPDVCEKAVRPDLTDSEFYELCTHEDHAVRHIALANPQCPPEWRTLVELKEN